MDSKNNRSNIFLCPVCSKKVPIDEIFLKQESKEFAQPIACTRCIIILYWAIPKEQRPFVLY